MYILVKMCDFDVGSYRKDTCGGVTNLSEVLKRCKLGQWAGTFL